MTSRPATTVTFRYHPIHALVCLLPEASAADAVRTELAQLDPALDVTRLLVGAEGIDAFDINGTGHGLRGRVSRTMQQLGSVENIMLAFERGLREGEALATIACARDDALGAARIVDRYDAHAIVYFSRFGLELFSSL